MNDINSMSTNTEPNIHRWMELSFGLGVSIRGFFFLIFFFIILNFSPGITSLSENGEISFQDIIEMKIFALRFYFFILVDFLSDP